MHLESLLDQALRGKKWRKLSFQTKSSEKEAIMADSNFIDYVKIFCKDAPKPILSLCSMKYMEEKLPADEFIRVHRSFIVRMDCISAIGRSTLLIEQKDVPIGDAYRERVKGYVSRLAVL